MVIPPVIGIIMCIAMICLTILFGIAVLSPTKKEMTKRDIDRDNELKQVNEDLRNQIRKLLDEKDQAHKERMATNHEVKSLRGENDRLREQLVERLEALHIVEALKVIRLFVSGHTQKSSSDVREALARQQEIYVALQNVNAHKRAQQLSSIGSLESIFG